MNSVLKRFEEIWGVDFEFNAPDGELPTIRCMVAVELNTGRCIRIWIDELEQLDGCPFDTDNSVVVAYMAAAEMACFQRLGWRQPKHILDLYVEFRAVHNGLPVTAGYGLIGAMVHYGLDAIESAEKDAMRELAIRGGIYDEAERVALLDYCESDVRSLKHLLNAMSDQIEPAFAFHRGRYMWAVAAMELRGIPLDNVIFSVLRDNWNRVQHRLIDEVDSAYGVFENYSFSQRRFELWLNQNNLGWPRLPSGRLSLDDDAFKSMARQYPQVSQLHELRQSLGEMRLAKLSVGGDFRNRTSLFPFGSKTGRNQPGNSRFIFGPSCWMRGLIKPPTGRAVAYIDYSQQEVAIAAALSGDEALMHAYQSSDPYLTFAIQAGAVPANATKETHKSERELFKSCVLGTQYGMQSWSLARSIDRPEPIARDLLRLHRETYPRYWAWSESAVTRAMLLGDLYTTFNWRVRVGSSSNARSLANFPMQANGAEMLRLACCLCVERGVELCAPVHDAIMIEADADDIENAIAVAKSCMAEAGRVVLDGFEMRMDADVVVHPNRYMDPRGVEMWGKVMTILSELTGTKFVDD